MSRGAPLRWRRRRGGRFSGPEIHELRRGDAVLALMQATPDRDGWFWYSRQEAGLPHINTADRPEPTLAQAKEACVTWVRANLPGGS